MANFSSKLLRRSSARHPTSKLPVHLAILLIRAVLQGKSSKISSIPYFSPTQLNFARSERELSRCWQKAARVTLSEGNGNANWLLQKHLKLIELREGFPRSGIQSSLHWDVVAKAPRRLDANETILSLLLRNALLRHVCFFVSPFSSLCNPVKHCVLELVPWLAFEGISICFFYRRQIVISSSQSTAMEESIEFSLNCRVTEYIVPLPRSTWRATAMKAVNIKLPVDTEQWLPFRFPSLIGISGTFTAICESPFYFHLAPQTFRLHPLSPSEHLQQRLNIIDSLPILSVTSTWLGIIKYSNLPTSLSARLSWRRTEKKDAEIKLSTAMMMVMLTSKLGSAVNGKPNGVMQMKNDKFRNVRHLPTRRLIDVTRFGFETFEWIMISFRKRASITLPVWDWHEHLDRQFMAPSRDAKLRQQKRSTDSLDCCGIFVAYEELLIRQQRKRRRADEVAKIYKKKIRSLSHFIVANFARSGLCGGWQAKEAKKEEKKFSSAGKFVSKSV